MAKKWIVHCLETFVVFSSVQEVIFSKLQLYGPDSILRGEPINVTCTSDTPPVGNTAEFLVNGRSYNNIRHYNGNCFTTVNGGICLHTECGCSMNSKTYFLLYFDRLYGDKVTFKCKMKVLDGRNRYMFVEDSTVVRIRDLETELKITKHRYMYYPEFRNIAQVTCLVNLTYELDVIFNWNCGNSNLPISTFINQTTAISTIDVSYDVEVRCTCKAKWSEFYNVSTTKYLPLKHLVNLNVSNPVVCNISSDIKLECSSEDISNASTVKWVHTINGVYIRTMTATVSETVSYMPLTSCRFEDVGNYTCILQNFDAAINESVEVNGKTSVEIAGPPVLGNRVVHTFPGGTKFVVGLYSYREVQCKWFKKHKLLKHSDIFVQEKKNSDFNFIFFDKNVSLDGFTCTLTVNDMRKNSDKVYEFCAENLYGETWATFDSKTDLEDIYKKDMVWLLVGSLMIVVVLCLSLKAFQVKNRQQIRYTDVIQLQAASDIERQRNNHQYHEIDVTQYESSSTHEPQYEEIDIMDNDEYLDPIDDNYDKVDSPATS